MNIKKSLPATASLSSLCCGFLSILCSIGGNFDLAGWLIVLSMILDSLDGKLARLTKTDSQFGAQLDSLIDLVVFGVAPVIMVGQLCKDTYQIIVWITCFFYLACAAIRLAKFNVIENDKSKPLKFYTGLPSTIAGGTIAQLALLHNYIHGSHGITALLIVIPVVTFLLGLLMVSKLRFYNIMSKISIKQQGIFPFGLEIGVSIILFAINPRLALSISLSAYIIVCGLFGLIKKDVSSEHADVTIV